MRSQTAERVVQARFDRTDRTVDDLRDLGEVQAVQVMQHDDEPVLGPKLVDRAKGKLMDLHGMGEAEAFGFMRKTAMDTRSTLKAVAQDVIDGTLKP